MSDSDFGDRVLRWALGQPDIEALIQIGSRAQASAKPDVWSDWDYHIIAKNAGRFRNTSWPKQIGEVWCAHLEKTDRAVEKLSVIFANGLEADFIPLEAWQMKLVYMAMAYPRVSRIYPRALTRGILSTILIVRPGYRILLGAEKWEKRLAAVNAPWPRPVFTPEQFQHHLSGFWRNAIWVQKKICRGELQAALRWFHTELVTHRWALLEEECRIEGGLPRPEARKAEIWLNPLRQKQSTTLTAADRKILSDALLAEIALFESLSKRIGAKHGIKIPDYAPISNFLRCEISAFASRCTNPPPEK